MSDADALVLRAPLPSDEAVAREAQAALAADGFDFGLRPEGEPWLAYLDRLDREHRGEDLPPGRVASTFLYAEVGGRVVGRASIRHTLTDTLCVEGGHVGYAVLPAERRRGYATAILRRSLAILRDRGVGPVLVTCREDNPGSLEVIRRCGGVLDPGWPSSHPDGDQGAALLRFWIPPA
ncbi:GNAT family N-acetyltransferase [Actinomycetospora lutea]|uniref:GNAT family N-acetyltransferase n=1 Tax=Actinomycetospora lutea TaxID=663604 RepID=UPI0023671C85|nr:GNAT family N-acetyltransferase [Actinomycetospora lutea]MDD7941923.1 GNAT family N-acetyltransferase [Actinomycetospora lutea]